LRPELESLKMKNLSLILNIVLLVAVAVLFYLHFSPKKSSTQGGSAIAAGDLKIAYVNSDSVVKYYEFCKINQKALEAKSLKMQQEFDDRRQALQNDYNAYQRNVNSMTLGQVKATEEDLGKKQQNLQMYQQTLSQQLSIEENKFQKDLYDKITAFCAKYGTENGFQVIMKKDVTSDILFGSDALDISQGVIKGLNDEFAKGTGAKSDTTAVAK
jgi:outer membrane protein